MKTPSHEPVAGFYDRLSTEYDVMTGFVKRFAREETVFRKLVRRYRVSTAVDAGCGTGFHSCILARLGVDVTGVDVSAEMLARAASRANHMSLKVQFLESTFGDLGTGMHGRVDSVFCLGNSFAHLLLWKDVLKALRAFSAILKPKGILFLQMLNYDRIMCQRLRVQSVKEEGDRMFIRFYDFERDRIRFNILRLRRTPDGFQHHLDSVYLRPILRAELQEALATVGFRHVSIFGSPGLEKFDSDASVDIFVVARK